MKPRQLATLIGISPATLRRWAGIDYREFLSPKGQGINGAYRSFDEQDARILAWIALMRTQNVSVEEIYLTLKTAQTEKWKNLPPLPGGIVQDEPISVVPREAVEERIQALAERYELQLKAVIAERDELRAHMATVQEENSQLRERLYAMSERILHLTERLAGLLEEKERRRPRE